MLSPEDKDQNQNPSMIQSNKPLLLQTARGKDSLSLDGAETSQWFYRPKPLVQPRMRMFCFPYAGGSAGIFRQWQEYLPNGVEIWAVELPGHQRRFAEPLVEDLSELLNRLEEEFLRLSMVPFVFFGHSLGGLIAFELTRRLSARGAIQPKELFISATVPPSREKPRDHARTLSDREFIKWLTELGGIPEAILQEEELLSLMLPVLRADIGVSERWRSPMVPPLKIGFSILGGNADANVAIGDLEAWKTETQGKFDMYQFPGGHFFIQSHKFLVLKTIGEKLSKLLGLFEED